MHAGVGTFKHVSKPLIYTQDSFDLILFYSGFVSLNVQLELIACENI